MSNQLVFVKLYGSFFKLLPYDPQTVNTEQLKVVFITLVSLLKV